MHLADFAWSRATPIIGTTSAISAAMIPMPTSSSGNVKAGAVRRVRDITGGFTGNGYGPTRDGVVCRHGRAASKRAVRQTLQLTFVDDSGFHRRRVQPRPIPRPRTADQIDVHLPLAR